MHTYTILGHSQSPAESVNITIKIDNQLLFSGPVPSASTGQATGDRIELCRWDSKTLLSGNVIISGTVNGGDLYFSLIAEIFSNNSESDPQEHYSELEYPDSMANMHAVVSVTVDNVAQLTPVNIHRVDNINDIRGWHYLIPNSSEFEIVYFSGPFPEEFTASTGHE